jgi:hypothetical protein
VGTRSHLIQDALLNSLAARGSHQSQRARVRNFAGFIAFLATIGMVPQSVADIDEWTVHAYSSRMRAEGFSAAHICNVLSDIRVIFLAAGRDLLISSSDRNRGVSRRNRRRGIAS